MGGEWVSAVARGCTRVSVVFEAHRPSEPTLRYTECIVCTVTWCSCGYKSECRVPRVVPWTVPCHAQTVECVTSVTVRRVCETKSEGKRTCTMLHDYAG